MNRAKGTSTIVWLVDGKSIQLASTLLDDDDDGVHDNSNRSSRRVEMIMNVRGVVRGSRDHSACPP